MNFFERIFPLYIPRQVADKGDLDILRERIMQSIMLVLLVVSLVQIGLQIPRFDQADQRFMLFYYIGLWIPVFFITVFRELPFTMRKNILCNVIYFLAISEVIESGEIGDLRMTLLVFVSIVALLYHWRVTIISILISVVTIFGIVQLGNTAQAVALVPFLARVQQENASWVLASVTFTVYSGVVSGAINRIINGLENSFHKQADMVRGLETERQALEQRVQERTQDITRRMVQIRTVSELTRSMSAVTDPDELLRQNIELIRERFDLYYVGIFLLDAAGAYAVLRAGTGEAGRKMLADGHRLAIGGSSMIGWTIMNRQPRIALDVGADAVRFSNPNLPLTHSELAIPIIVRDKILGAMTVQSSEANAFDRDDIEVLQGLADGLGTALDNANQFQETRQNLEEFRALNLENLQRAWAETIATYGELSYSYENTGMPAAGNGENAHTIEVPLTLRNEVIGHILLETDRSKLSDDEVTFVDNITNQTAIALENARLLEETERRAIQEQKLNELTSRFSRALSIDEILRAAAQELGQLPAVAGVSVRLAPGGTPTQTTGAYRPASSGNGKEPTAS